MVSSTNDAGLGWVILSSGGIQSFKASAKCVISPLTAEGLALRESVRTCVDLGLKTVIFEADSSQLIKTAKSEACATEIYGVMADISSYVLAFDFVFFS